MNLSDKYILITGGSSGIGLATAKMAKEKGAHVIITGRNEAKLVKSAEKFGLKYFKCDVSKEDEVKKLFQHLKNESGKLDALINNAGFGYFDELANISRERFTAIYETNVLGAAFMAREAAEIFKAQKYGTIINIGSTAASKGFPGGTAYVASKYALRGMTECWRAELRKFNIRVILINPSEVQTLFSQNAELGIRKFNESKLIPEDIAHAIISTLEMNDRGFTTELTVFATNPKD